MTFLEYLQLANGHQALIKKDKPFSIALVTNFTDDIFAKILTGVCIKNNVVPEIYKAPYKQYSFELKNQSSKIWQAYNIVFFFFDVNFFVHSEFSDNDNYTTSLLNDLENYVSRSSGTVVVNSFLLPYWGPGANKVVENQLFLRAQRVNMQLNDLAKKYSNLQIFDINRLIYIFGDKTVRDLRGLYAFDTPFTNDFLTQVAQEWFAYIGALNGKAKKVIVVDLDNTLWGGVVGETGPTEIALGPGYPGMAFQNFQRTLLEYQKSGILLAINSKNNMADVEEVFEKNPHMILKKDHFVSIMANWDDKATNLKALSKQLNLGLDSFIFLDDDSMQRELIKTHLPEVLVPDFSNQPEHYACILNSLAVFSPFAQTEEDRSKNNQYQKEQLRQNLLNDSGNLQDFIANLNIVLDVSINNKEHLPRISQLTLKTNQFNVTTRRYALKETEDLMLRGQVFAANIKDKFGDYGLTAIAIVLPEDKKPGIFILDSLLMSCRVLGRGVEFSFLDFITRKLHEESSVKILKAEFVPTAKNDPAKNFFADFGFKETEEKADGLKRYSLDIETYLKNTNPKVYESIIINPI